MLLWIVLYFLLGFMTSIALVIMDLKAGEIVEEDPDYWRLVMISIVFWPAIVIYSLCTNIAKIVIFLGKVIKEWTR